MVGIARLHVHPPPAGQSALAEGKKQTETIAIEAKLSRAIVNSIVFIFFGASILLAVCVIN
jgi:hypothetical protein